jgi:hypothetical protein
VLEALGLADAAIWGSQGCRTDTDRCYMYDPRCLRL